MTAAGTRARVRAALTRYFPSRDDLLTALIVAAYDALGDAAERAEAPVPRADLRGRFRAACGAVRTWALAHPHEYALVYGSPVPGYAAPSDTVGPAARVGVVLGAILADGVADGRIEPGADGTDATLHPGVAAAVGVPSDGAGSLAARAIQVWIAVYGLVSFELFGHLHNVVDRREEYFAAAVDRLADSLGLPPE